MRGRWAEKVVYLTQGRADSAVDIITTMLVSTKRNGNVVVMGCWFSDEVIVVVKWNADEDAGDPSEDKPFHQRHGAKGEGRNMI